MSESVNKKREYRQKQIATKARIKYREHSLQQLRGHRKNGTFPKRMKSLKPYPKMDTPEAQAIVNEACQQVDKVILDQMIQEQAMKLKEDQDSLQTVNEERQPQQCVTPETDFQTFLIASLRKEASDLRAKNAVLKRKYTLLSRKMGSTPVKQEPQQL